MTFFVIGAVSMYFYNLNWIRNARNVTQDLIFNFKDTYDIQEKLKKNYYDTYMFISDTILGCYNKKEQCTVENITSEIKRMEAEREDLDKQLNAKNRETEAFLDRLP